METGWVDLALEFLDNPNNKLENALREHAAFRLLESHYSLSNNGDVNSHELLKKILNNKLDIGCIKSVTGYWASRQSELLSIAAGSLIYLPEQVPKMIPLFYILGYDIGVAMPWGAAVNVAHKRFCKDHGELPHLIAHELHHVGFLSQRVLPRMDSLSSPDSLRKAICFFTQMEGMAVHAAYPGRKKYRRLGTDEDYRIYTDRDFAFSVLERYKVIMEMTQGDEPLSDDTLDTVLDAMSNEERLWYRAGAIAAWNTEKKYGRERLVRSINNPSLFFRILSPENFRF